MHLRESTKTNQIFCSCCLALLAAFFSLFPTNQYTQGLAALVTLMLPGVVACEVFFQTKYSSYEKSFFQCSFGFISAAAILYLLQLLPGPISSSLTIGSSCILTLLIGHVALRPNVGERSRSPINCANKDLKTSFILLAAIIIGSYFRIAHLGSSEFQGDEARAMIMVAAIHDGTEDILFSHTKGPVEVLMPLATSIGSETTNEFLARLPFALAGVFTILGVFILVNYLSLQRSPWVASLAALLVANDGFLIAFSRIVQYQSLVVLWSLAGLILALKALQTKNLEQTSEQAMRYFALSYLAVAFAVLAHYDGIFVLAPIGLLTFVYLYRYPREILKVALATLPSLFALAIFFIPYLQSDNIGSIYNYLARRTTNNRQGLSLRNNFPQYFMKLCFYNEARYLILLLCLSAFGVVKMVGNCLNKKYRLHAFVVLAWLAFGAITYGCIIRRPNTHFYVAIIPALLLAAFGFEFIKTKALEARPTGWLATLLFTSAFCFALFYNYRIYLVQYPSYQVYYPEGRNPLFYTPYGNKRPSGGYFGFPHNGGWKSVGSLDQQGKLNGSLRPNEDPLVVSWYLGRLVTREQIPQFYALSTKARETRKVEQNILAKHYKLKYQVTSQGRDLINIYQRVEGDLSAEIERLEIKDLIQSFDQRKLSTIKLTQSLSRDRHGHQRGF